MTKAQKIRNERIKAININLEKRDQKVFDWILDLIDADTKNKNFLPIELYIFNEKGSVKFIAANAKNNEYSFDKQLIFCDILKFITKLKDVIEKEEGFYVFVEPDVYFGYSQNIILKVFIK